MTSPRQDDESPAREAGAYRREGRFNENTILRIFIIAIVFILFLMILAFAWTPFSAP